MGAVKSIAETATELDDGVEREIQVEEWDDETCSRCGENLATHDGLCESCSVEFDLALAKDD